MTGFLKKITNLIVGDETQFGIKKQSVHSVSGSELTYRELLRQESKIGATLFGSAPKGHHREFFCLDESTWIWYEEWKDEKGVERQMTVRYEIHPNGVLKVSDGPRYQFLEGDELRNFAEATQLYYEQTAVQIYNRDPRTGLKLA